MSETQTRWMRLRFQANADDPRPVTFPPPGPWWCTGYAGDDSYAIVVAYLPNNIVMDKAAFEADVTARVEGR